MYKIMKDELNEQNKIIYDVCKRGGCEYWPGYEPDNKHGREPIRVDDYMVTLDKYVNDLVNKRFGYDTKEKKKKRGMYYFITINMPHTKDEEMALNLYDKMQLALTKYKWLRKSIYNIEFYTSEGSHPHCHCYVETEKRRDCIIKILSTFFDIQPNFIDIKKYYGDGQGHINYIKGLKKEDIKQEYINKDIELRNKYNIEHYIDNI